MTSNAKLSDPAGMRLSDDGGAMTNIARASLGQVADARLTGY